MDKIVALTFDDGPDINTTSLVLDRLDKYCVLASFFVIGDRINIESTKVMERALSMGCEIQNHSKTHTFMTELNKEQIIKEIKETSEKIKEITKVEPTFFRPPYIAVNELMFETIDLPFIFGCDGKDWEDTISSEERAQRILDQVTDGSIILLHDMPGNMKTVDALDLLIPELQKRGYEFVTISQAFKRRNIVPKAHNGVIYSNVKDWKAYLNND